MTEPYLIAHLVRGSPAFDIAEQIQIGDEVGWIIPTSGHRAYPYWSTRLDVLVEDPSEGIMYTPVTEYKATRIPPDPWPDHYSTSAAPKGTGLITNLAERLGFVPKPPTISRR